MSKSKYEVEIKVEVYACDADTWLSAITDKILSLGGRARDVRLETTDDYVFAVPQSMIDRHDYAFVRIRQDMAYSLSGGSVRSAADITTKRWVRLGDSFTREESSRQLESSEFELVQTLFQGSVCTIRKKRQEFEISARLASDRALDMVIACDQVFFNNETQPRFFVEAEVVTDDKTLVGDIREVLRSTLKSILEILQERNLAESRSYFALAMEGK